MSQDVSHNALRVARMVDRLDTGQEWIIRLTKPATGGGDWSVVVSREFTERKLKPLNPQKKPTSLDKP